MVRLSDLPAIIEFGHFSILPHRRQLLAEGRPIRLGGRAFDLLLALIEAPGAVVGKDELLSRIWPGRIVEENRLQNPCRRRNTPAPGHRSYWRKAAPLSKAYPARAKMQFRAMGFTCHRLLPRVTPTCLRPSLAYLAASFCHRNGKACGYQS